MATMKKLKRHHKSLDIDQSYRYWVRYNVVKNRYHEYGIGQPTVHVLYMYNNRYQATKLHDYKRKMTEMEEKRPVNMMKLGKDKELKEALFYWHFYYFSIVQTNSIVQTHLNGVEPKLFGLVI